MQNPINAVYPAGNGFFDGLEAIAMTWIRWKCLDSMNDIEIQFITLVPHLVGIANANPRGGEGVRDFLTRAIVHFKKGHRPEPEYPT
jgi:hypothetical protein